MNKTIVTILCFLLAIGLAFGLVLPKYQVLGSKMNEAKTKESNLSNMNDYYKKVAEVSVMIKKYPEEMAKIDFALPDEISLPLMYDFFQQRASEAGLILIEESGSKVNSKNDLSSIKEWQFVLDLAGSYTSFKNFLSILENSARLIEVKNISITSPEKIGESFHFSATVKFHSY